MKRISCIAAAALMVAGMLAGCSSGGNSQPAASGTSQNAAAGSSEEKVTITYLSRYSNPEEPRSKFYMAKLEEFRAANPNIEVIDISVQDGNAYLSKLKSSIAAGTPPDIFITDGFSQMVDLVKNDMVRDLSPLLASEEWTGTTDPDILMPFTFQNYGIDGVYGVPNQVVTEQMFVNTKLLADYGFKTPETWEDIIAMVPAFEEKNIAPVGLGSKIGYRSGAFHTALYLKMFGVDFRTRYNDGTLKWTDPDSVAVYQKFDELVKAGVFGPDDIAMDDLTLVEEFCKGNYPMVISPSFFFSSFQKAEIAKDIKVINIPYFKDKPEYKNTWNSSTQEGFAISSAEGTPAFEASKKLLTMLLSEETFTEYANLLGGGVFPVKVDFDSSKADNIMKSFMDAYALHDGVGDDLARYSKVTNLLDIFWSETQTIFVGRTPEEITKTLQAEEDKRSA